MTYTYDETQANLFFLCNRIYPYHNKKDFTVKQENFATGFREIGSQAGSRQENFPNLWIEEVLSQIVSVLPF